MVLRYLTMFSSTSPLSSLTCRGIHTEKKKRQKKSIFIYGTTFKKNESGRDFQRVQIWNDRSQKQKKNYGSHPVLYRFFTPPLSGIGKLPALAGRYFRFGITVGIFIGTIWREHLLKISRDLFF
jgi:hypothetical protein